MGKSIQINHEIILNLDCIDRQTYLNIDVRIE